MRIFDPGHIYELSHLDGDDRQTLVFVKREGEGYPGNVGHHEGTNLQEVLRACIDRVTYVNGQISSHHNPVVLMHLREAIWHLEARAAERHGRRLSSSSMNIEREPTCGRCGSHPLRRDPQWRPRVFLCEAMRRRNTQLVRTIRLMTLLRTGQHSLDALAKQFAVSGRTIRRDLSALEDANVPVYTDHNDAAEAVWGVLR